MSDYGLFFDSVNGDRIYSASSMEEWLKPFFKTGVFSNQLAVTAVTGMQVSISGGYCNVGGKVRFFNETTTMTLDPADGSQTRIDSIVIERDDAERHIILKKINGVPGGGATPRVWNPQSGVYQLVLALITVEAGDTSITQADIQDKRLDGDWCGTVAATVSEIDFTTISRQFDAFFSEFQTDKEDEFDTWFEHIQEQLDDNIVANLQHQIDQANQAVDDLADDVDNEIENTLPTIYEQKNLYQSYTIRATGWSGTNYSLEATFPSSTWDIQDILIQNGASQAQRQAWMYANCGGYYSTNTITAKGVVPTIDIPVYVLKRKRVS